MIFLKNKISIHPHALQFTGGVCFVFLFLYFKSDRFVGQAELGLGASLGGEEPGGQLRPFVLPTGQGRVRWTSPPGDPREILALLWAPVQALAPAF